MWSKASRDSFWVQGEAAYSYNRDVYLPVQIDEKNQPQLFGHVQAQSIAKFAGQKNGGDEELARLKEAIISRIGKLPMFGNLEQVAPEKPVTDAHLQIIHSCWRVDKKLDSGIVMPYQIQLIIYGHETALERIKSVDYKLPGYPEGHESQSRDDRSQLFELKELANGFSIIQAHVHLKSQPPTYPKMIRLSRFINMSESGPRLLDDFIGRSRVKTKK